MSPFLQILGSVVPLFLLMAIGAAIRRWKVLNAQADRTLLNLVVQVLTPCLILDHVVANQSLRQWDNLLLSPLLGFGCTAGGVAFAALVARFARLRQPSERRTFSFTAGVFNYNYVPIPLVSVIYGSEALGILFLFNLGVETAFWLIGFSALQGHSIFQEWRKALTMPVRAILLAVAINLGTAAFGLTLDEATLNTVAWGWLVKVIMNAIHLIGLCNIPLALLLIGATMADFWTDVRIGRGLGVMTLAVLIRNVISPLIFIALACLPLSRELKETLVVQAAMPAAVFPLLLAKHHGGSVPVALQIIMATSVVAMVTLPLWIRFGMSMAGVH